MPGKKHLPANTEFLLYQSQDGKIRIETRMQNETVWLTINQMSELFDVDKSGISRHLKNIFESGELSRESVVAIFATTAAERKNEVAVAKNYLIEEELDILNRIVTAYLEFAELQALNRKPMYMKDWIAKLDDFLKMSGRELLEHAGAISHDRALQKALDEYELFHSRLLKEPTIAEKDFIEAEKKFKKIESVRKKKGR